MVLAYGFIVAVTKKVVNPNFHSKHQVLVTPWPEGHGSSRMLTLDKSILAEEGLMTELWNGIKPC